ADIESSVSGLAPRVVDTEVYAVFARQKKPNAEPSGREEFVRVEVRKAVGHLADAAEEHEAEATEKTEAFGKHEPVLPLRGEHRPVQVLSDFVPAQVVAGSEEAQRINGRVSRDVAQRGADCKDLALPDQKVLVVIRLIPLERAVAGEDGIVEVRLQSEVAAFGRIEGRVP